MLWSRESDVVADRQDDLLRLWWSTNSIDRSGTEQDVGFGFSGRSTIRGNSWKGEVALTTTLRLRSTVAVNRRFAYESIRLRVILPTFCSPTSRVDSPTSNMSVRLRLKLRAMTRYNHCIKQLIHLLDVQCFFAYDSYEFKQQIVE